MRKNSKSDTAISKLNKISELCGNPVIQLLAGVISAFIGLFLSEDMLTKSDKIIFSLLWFFVGIVVADKLSSYDFIKEQKRKNENFIVSLLQHLTEQVYGKLGHYGQHSRFSSGDDGLLRQYLYKESQHLQEAIINSKKGEYSLDNNIREFHTYAIQYMIDTLGNQYSVLHWVGGKSYEDGHKFNNTYDALDINFLSTLLKKVTQPDNEKNRNPYYKCKLPGQETFKIKWILVGKLGHMKNKFDYIFYVIDRLIQRNSYITKEIISAFFEFYIISEEEYEEVIEDINISYGLGTYGSKLHLNNEPNFGIFGNQFMFIDSIDDDSHGIIYTKKYIEERNQESLLELSLMIFNKILDSSTPVDFNLLLNEYYAIIKEDKEWLNQLNSISKCEIK